MNQLKRYQAKIKFIKYSFLVLGIGLMIATLIIVIDSLNPGKSKASTMVEININDRNPKLVQDCSLKVQNPVFSGLTNNLLPYTILADKMIKDKSNQYILESVSGGCLTRNGNITIKASGGNIDEMEKNIRLRDNILIIYNGASLKASQINLDINKQHIHSDKPVLIEFRNSYIEANRLESQGDSEVIKLEGGVRSVIKIDDFR